MVNSHEGSYLARFVRENLWGNRTLTETWRMKRNLEEKYFMQKEHVYLIEEKQEDQFVWWEAGRLRVGVRVVW